MYISRGELMGKISGSLLEKAPDSYRKIMEVLYLIVRLYVIFHYYKYFIFLYSSDRFKVRSQR